MADLIKFYQELLELERWRESRREKKSTPNFNQLQIYWTNNSKDTSTR